MNPQKNSNYQSTEHDILPAPQQVHRTATGAEAAFPPLGTTLSSYAPNAYGDASRSQSAVAQEAPKRNWKKIIKRTFIVLFIVALLAGGYVGSKVLMNAGKSLGGNLFGLLQTDKLKGEDTGRVNILLAGNSADDVGHSGGDLTDSIMIVSIDTKNNTAFMLSVPRDLWVAIPDHGYGKINSAYVFGKADNFSEPDYPAGGMGLLEKIIERDFEIDINYYALVNYTALRDAVNSVGGIDVTIASTDPRGLYDPSRDYSKPTRAPLVKLTNGVHSLDGQEALNLARARGDAYGAYGYNADYTRTANQRLMLTALKDKATSAGVTSNPIKIGSLLDSFGNNVLTDFQTNEVRRLASISKAIPSASIKSASLNDVNGKNLLTSYRSANGQSALIPATGVDDYTDITAYLTTLMTPPAPATPAQQ
ncbi:MAG TPA: LCP family protein [Candidatus Saccharimonadales bacterium]|jgi:LCP family protein required for cell wall assembly